MAIPNAPDKLRPNSTAGDKVTLYWRANGGGETSFRIERAPDGGSFSEIAFVGAGVTSYEDATVSDATGYWYKVRARNADGDSGYSESVSLTTPASSRSLTTLRIWPLTPRVAVGEDVMVVIEARDGGGTPFKNLAPVWSVGNSGIAELRLFDEAHVAYSRNYPSQGVNFYMATLRGVAAGTTTISATVDGTTATSRTITVFSRTATPVATLAGDVTNEGTLNVRVGEPVYVDTRQCAGIYRESIDWGDGNKTTRIPQATHAYVTPGTYTITLTIKNASGATATATATVVVTEIPASAAENIITVNSEAEIYAAYEQLATSGGTIRLPASITYGSSILLGERPSNVTTWITFERTGQTLPSLKKRISITGNVSSIATLSTTVANEPPIRLANNAHHLRFRGINFYPANDTYEAFAMGSPNWPWLQRSHSLDPHHIIVEHCVINPHDDRALVHGFSIEGHRVSVLSCDFRNCKATSDAQAIFAIDGQGKHYIYNCFLEATGENVMYGGGDIQTVGHVPTSITFRKCHFFRRLSWRTNPRSAPYNWAFKNLFEIKSASNVYVEGCILENEWLAAQSVAVILKSVNQGNWSPWAIGEYIHFENIWLRHVSNAIGTSWDNPIEYPCLKPQHCYFTNVLITDCNNVNWGQHGDVFKPQGASNVEIDHVTAPDYTGRAAWFNDEYYNSYDIRVRDSVFGGPNDCFMARNAHGIGVQAIAGESQNRYTISRVVALASGGEAATYPSGNTFVFSVDAIGFANPGQNNYALVAGSPGKGYALDGTDSGINQALIDTATENTISGDWTGSGGGEPGNGSLVVRRWFAA